MSITLKVKAFIIILASILTLHGIIVYANDEGTEPPQKTVTFEVEPDMYYSSLDLYINLTEEKISNLTNTNEFAIYEYLIGDILHPKFLLFEASVYPMPLLGAFIKYYDQTFYNSFTFYNTINVLEAVTKGFEEPFAFSAFIGNVVEFTRPNEPVRVRNKGYMGFLFSIGVYHIKDNVLIPDTWYEVEWKIKGEKKEDKESLNWSFRLGAKLHSNRDVTDTLYLALKRMFLDFDAPAWSILRNSGFEYTFSVNPNFEPVSHYIYVEKKWPIKKLGISLDLAIGLVWESSRKYSGALRDPKMQDNYTLVFRPNIEF